MKKILGIDLGGTHIKCLLCTEAGERIETLQDRTEDSPSFSEAQQPPLFAQTIRNVVETLTGKYGAIDAIGISAPGLVASDQTAIAYMPGRLYGLQNFNWSTYLERTVPVLNDAQAALLGEIWKGSAQGLNNIVLLTLGTGVGGAIYADGRLLKGCIGRAGHFGHLCLHSGGSVGITGIPGSLENAIGDFSVNERSKGRFKDTKSLVQAVREGDAEAGLIWDHSLHHLACGIASIINIIDPEVILIGGGIANAREMLFAPLNEKLATIEWRPGGHKVELRPTEHGEWAGAWGAAYNALQSMSASAR